ncbi:MAG: hypothetical protein H0W65_07490 [Sphingomonas sp.]|uniref:hypothetical protein n=1 Tax=Sphingomonas sp. TaxID=28214 RepID=UPI0017E2384E|nr:hypothetical protein [Sphingomonas sp.]MBA3667548.1 hypothetical protein [Sphingomonas sp.]
MTSKTVKVFEELFAAKDTVVLRFDEHDAEIARNWSNTGKQDNILKARRLARI